METNDNATTDNTTKFDINEYMEDRVEAQIKWYDEKSQKAQKYYKIYQIIEILLAASIPILSGYANSSVAIAVIVGIAGALIAIIESITKLYRFHENWIQYRSTCELLRYQKYLFVTRSAPYNPDTETIENIFVRNIENIISAENNQWKNLNNDMEPGNKADQVCH